MVTGGVFSPSSLQRWTSRGDPRILTADWNGNLLQRLWETFLVMTSPALLQRPSVDDNVVAIFFFGRRGHVSAIP